MSRIWLIKSYCMLIKLVASSRVKCHKFNKEKMLSENWENNRDLLTSDKYTENLRHTE